MLERVYVCVCVFFCLFIIMIHVDLILVLFIGIVILYFKRFSQVLMVFNIISCISCVYISIFRMVLFEIRFNDCTS